MDLSTIISSIVFAVILAILWGHPVLRTINKVWFIAWKTVPAGCMTILLLPALCYLLLTFLRNKFGLVSQPRLRSFSMFLLLIAFVLGIAVIVLLTRHILRRERIGKEWYALPSVAVFMVCSIFCVVLNLGEMMYSVVRCKNQRYFSEENVCWLPKPQNPKETRLALIQQNIHPFFAEYDYTLLMRRAAEDGRDKRIFLFVNTGGQTKFNLYRLRDGRQLWQDKDACFLIDPFRNEVLQLKFICGALYGGKVNEYKPSEKDHSFSFGWQQENDGEVFFCPGGHKIPAEKVDPAVLDGKVYFGAITYDFYPAEKMPEEPFPDQMNTEPSAVKVRQKLQETPVQPPQAQTQSTSIEPSGR